MLVQYVESESSWKPSAAKGSRNGGIDFQVDKVSADALGSRPTLLALEGWPELP
jgi:hypothetical protein